MDACTLVTNTTLFSVGYKKNMTDLFAPDYSEDIGSERQIVQVS